MTDTTALPDTPCMIIDLPTVDRNIARFQSLAEAAGLKTRPHIKTHKLPLLAARQMAAGAIGITCQKIGEAEVMAESGIPDILITYNIVGPEKLARLVALSRRCKLSVTCDTLAVARGLSGAFDAAGSVLDVLVECDTGAGRCGVQTPEDAANLAQRIDALPGLRFAGLMTYPPMGDTGGADTWLAHAAELIHAAGLSCDVISTGGTPNMAALAGFAHASEHRAGTYIYNDRSLVQAGACGPEDCAGIVHATVVSRPTATRAILDAGSKALSSDLLGMQGFGLIREAPEAQITALSEEHATVDLTRSPWQPEVGARVTIIPNHVCVVTNLCNTVYLRHADGRLEETPVAARGLLR